MHAAALPVTEAPAPLNRPTVALTSRGANLLALLACRDRMTADDALTAFVCGELDRRIASLLDVD